MNERLVLAVVGGFAVVLVAAGFLLLGTEGPAASSTLSRDSRGWLAARRYLEARGSQVTLLDRDLEPAPAGGVLVLAFPWQGGGSVDVSSVIDESLQRGAHVMFAYSGEAYEGSESIVAGALELDWEEPRARPPLHPIRWRAYAREEWWLAPEDAAAGVRSARIGVPRRVPRMPAAARVLARAPSGLPVAFRFPRWHGDVLVLPAEAFSNARLGEPGNADLLESLREDLGPRWFFDEFHHGLRAAATTAGAGPQRIFALYLLQVAFVYALVVVAVAHRFGPAAAESPATTGSAAAFLLGLGGLHARLGHHREAALLLLARARELDPRLALPDPVEGQGEEFLALARRVGEAQSGKGTA
jgi:hypothetical protein